MAATDAMGDEPPGIRDDDVLAGRRGEVCT